MVYTIGEDLTFIPFYSGFYKIVFSYSDYIEVNHEFIWRIIPKGTSLDEHTQYDINLMMSHINSYGRKRFNDRSPYRMFKAMYGEEVIKRLGIEKIPRDEINLTPELLKK